ncbi:MAG: DedA family protein [Thermoplasmata archaeon]
MTFSIIGSLVALITLVLATIGLPGLFALEAVENFGIPPIPSEVILPFAGFLVAEGTFSLGGALLAALAGSMVGAYAAYAVGRWWRSRLLGLGVGQLRVRADQLERMDAWFARRGEITVAVARIVPVVRSYVSYPAGTARMSPTRFGVYTLIGSIPWTLGLLYAGILLRSEWIRIEAYFEPLDIAFVILVVVAAVYFALVATGHLTPGWPPQRVARRPVAPPAPPAGTLPPPPR